VEEGVAATTYTLKKNTEDINVKKFGLGLKFGEDADAMDKLPAPR